MNIRDLFKKNFNILMKANNMTTKKLSNAINEPYTSIKDWQKGNAFPRDTKIDKICEYFNVKPYELFMEEYTNMKIDFKSKLIELRLDKNLTQEQVATALNIKRATIGDWEIGRTQPGLDELIKIADFFDCSTDYLLGKTECRNAEKELNELKKNILSLIKGYDAND